MSIAGNMKWCACLEWEIKTYADYVLGQLNGDSGPSYAMKYCPWCGSVLEDV